jgi:hypothetical protein
MTITERPTFTLRIQGKPGMGGIHQLRAVLKWLRRHGFRALDVREKHDAAEHGDDTITEETRL